MRPRGEVVQVAGDAVVREVAAGEGEIGGDVAVESPELLDLDRLQTSGILPGPTEQSLQLYPAAAVGGDELVDGGQ